MFAHADVRILLWLNMTNMFSLEMLMAEYLGIFLGQYRYMTYQLMTPSRLSLKALFAGYLLGDECCCVKQERQEYGRKLERKAH